MCDFKSREISYRREERKPEHINPPIIKAGVDTDTGLPGEVLDHEVSSQNICLETC